MKMRLLATTAVALALVLAAALPVTGPAAAASASQPDALIRKTAEVAFWGNGVYNRNGDRQARTVELQRGQVTSFFVKVQNDGPDVDDLRISGTRETSAFAVRYFLGPTRVSDQVKAGTFVLRGVPAGGERVLRVEVEATPRARPGDSRRTFVRSISQTDGRVDVVRATTRIPLFTPEQERIAELVNQTRASSGRNRLALNRTLTAKAQRWAEYLAGINRLAHSTLTAGVPSNWRALGENVGYGRTIAGVHQAFMGSSGHRANILGSWNAIGTGHATGHGRVFVVQVFMRT